MDVTVHPHAVVKYNTDITPHTILVKRNSKVFQTVAIGAQSLTSIEKSVSSDTLFRKRNQCKAILHHRKR